MTIVPPSSEKAEVEVLSAMMSKFTSSAAKAEMAYRLTEEEFYSSAHKVMWGLQRDLYVEHGHVDFQMLAEKCRGLENGDQIKATLRSGYVHSLADKETFDASAYTDILISYSTARRGVLLGQKLATDCDRNSPDDSPEIMHAASLEISKAAVRSDPEDAPLSTVAEEVITEFENPDSTPRIPSGIPELDMALDGGLAKKTLTVVGARRGVGKTAFGIHWAVQAMRAGKRVVYLSQEMSRKQMVGRLLSLVSGVRMSNRSGFEISETELEALQSARDVLADWNPLIYDRPISVSQLSSACRHWSLRKRLDFLVIDYVQKMRLEKAESNQIALSQIVGGAKDIAMEHGIPVLALAQIRREGEHSPIRPTLATLKGTGSIEEDADAVLLMWPGGLKTTLRCALDKNRHGMTLEFGMYVDFSIMRMTGLEPGHEE